MLMVQAIMTADPITIGPDEPLLQAVSAMERGRFRRLPVVKDGRVVGIITDRDIRKALSSPVVFHAKAYDAYLLREVKIAGCMTRDILSVGPDTPLAEAAALMERHKIGGVPVIKGGCLVGILTVSDLIAYLIKTLSPPAAG